MEAFLSKSWYSSCCIWAVQLAYLCLMQNYAKFESSQEWYMPGKHQHTSSEDSAYSFEMFLRVISKMEENFCWGNFKKCDSCIIPQKSTQKITLFSKFADCIHLLSRRILALFICMDLNRDWNSRGTTEAHYSTTYHRSLYCLVLLEGWWIPYTGPVDICEGTDLYRPCEPTKETKKYFPSVEFWGENTTDTMLSM